MIAKVTNPFRLRRVERMRPDDVLSTYCPPRIKTQLDDARHIILQGPRGSGKSTILRNITASPSSNSGSLSPEGELIVGTYINVGQQWVAGFQRRGWLSTENRDLLFIQAFNLLVAQQFAHSLARFAAFVSETPADASRLEAQFISALWSRLFRSPPPISPSHRELQRECESTQRALRDSALRFAFEGRVTIAPDLLLSELFEPIQSFISSFQLPPNLPRELLWVFAFDELDNLSTEQQVYFNTVIRTTSRPITIKGACLPHGHSTLQTLATNNPVMPGEDFDYVALTLNPKSSEANHFSIEIYKKRIQATNSDLPLEPVEWLGDAPLRERAVDLLEKTFGKSSWEEVIVSLFGAQGASLRGMRASSNLDSIRQHIPALAMRMLRKSAIGNASVNAYSGWSDVVAASDGNPRRLLRLLDKLFESSTPTRQISPEVQSSVMRSTAEGAFERLVALPKHGRLIQSLIDLIGNKLEARLHDSSGLPRESCSIRFNLAETPEQVKSALETAIAYGVLFPWSFDPRNGYPTGMHDYWLSFSLAPRFWLVLRRGRPLSLEEIYSIPANAPSEDQLLLDLAFKIENFTTSRKP